MENKEEFLPIGSVVLLKGAPKKMMITGYLSIVPETREEFDYKNAIEKVVHVGYSDDEQKNFNNELIELSKKMEAKMKEEQNVTKENTENR